MSDSESKQELSNSPAIDKKPSPKEGEYPSTAVFEPLITLPELEVKTLEEDEIEILLLRAKLYRFHMPLEEDESAEWKEKGVGVVKLLQHQKTNKVRVVMRRDKTLKICANHFITKEMELKPIIGNDRALIWKTPGDYSDGSPNPETLCMRFESVDHTNFFKEKFLEVVNSLNGEKDVSEKLDALKIEEKEAK